MTNETLAQYANLAVYSAMVVFTIAMIAFAIDLAGAAPRSSAGATEARAEPALVGAGSLASGATHQVPPDGKDLPRVRKAAGIAMMLTRLGGLLLIAAAAMRGLSVHRPPLGNMFEFALVGGMFVIVLFVAFSPRRDLPWPGPSVGGPVRLTRGRGDPASQTHPRRRPRGRRALRDLA